MLRKGLYFYLLVTLVLLALGGQTVTASARGVAAPLLQTITVTTTKDDIQKNGNCTLREAVLAANTNKAVDKCLAGSTSSTDLIRLGKGTYVLSLTGRGENAAKQGDLDITQPLKIYGAGISATIIDGKMIDRVFENHSSSGTVTIQDLTIKNGLAYPPNNDLVDQGGAIANAGKMIVNRVRFVNNVVDGNGDDGAHGGAIFSTGTLTVSNSQFETNKAGTGGALGISGVLKVDNSTFIGNTAYMAGAISIERDGAQVDITECRFESNTHGPGSASAILLLAGSILNIRYSTFEDQGGNEVIDTFGLLDVHASTFRYNPGTTLFNIPAGTVTIRYSTFYENPATTIVRISSGELNLTHSTVRGNLDNGGGVEQYGGRVILDRMTFTGNDDSAFDMYAGTARFHNSTITGSTDRQGAIQVKDGQLSIDMVTIADSTTDGSGALHVFDGAVTLHNSIVANTFHQDGSGPLGDIQVAPGTTTSLGYNLVSRSDGSEMAPAAGDLLGTIAEPIDPKLDVLKNNGGPTHTRALLPGSPAIDAADPVDFFHTDQRVYKRPAGARCDIGAFEKDAVR